MKPSRLALFLAVAAPVGLAFVACSEPEPARAPVAEASGGTGGAGGAIDVAAGSVSVGGDQCSACVAAASPSSTGICAADARCLACSTMLPYPDIDCFNNEPLLTVSTAACGPCLASCSGLACDSLPCATCLAKVCKEEYEGCSKKATCTACTLPNPPKSCNTEPLAIALYLCSVKYCKEDCKANGQTPDP